MALFTTISASTPYDADQLNKLVKGAMVAPMALGGLTTLISTPTGDAGHFDKLWAATSINPHAISPADFEKKYLADFPTPAFDVKAQRAFTCRIIKERFPHLQGVQLSRISGLGEGNEELYFNCLNEILHKANFHRDAYGYHNHRGYADHLEKLTWRWTPELHGELMKLAAATPVGKSELEQQVEQVALDKIAQEQLRRDVNQRAYDDSWQKRRAMSDFPNTLPEGIEQALADEVERCFGSAEVGVW